MGERFNTKPANDSLLKKWKAAIYLRISREDVDKEESDSITNQRELLCSFAKSALDITVVSESVDDGYSGASFQRPGFLKMIDCINDRTINCIIVKDLSRFGRNFSEAGRYIEHIFPFLGVRFIAVNNGVDTAKKKGHGNDIIIPFMNLINDAYCRDISVKIRSQLDVKRKKGDFVGSFAVYGYKKDERNKNRLVVDENAADIVRMIFRWKLEGQSQHGIADKLNSLGILSPIEYKKAAGLNFQSIFYTSGKAKWSAVAVGRILRDETYTGTLVQGKTSTPNHKISKKFLKPNGEWVRVADMHEAIVSQKDFQIANSLLTSDTRVAPGEVALYPYSGIIKCGNCGENLIRKPMYIKNKQYVYYICTNRCKGHRVSENTLNVEVATAFRTHIENTLDLEHILFFIENTLPKQEEANRIGMLLFQKRTEIEGNKNDKYNMTDYFKQYNDCTNLTRKMIVFLINKIVIYPKSRMNIICRYSYDYISTVVEPMRCPLIQHV